MTHFRAAVHGLIERDGTYLVTKRSPLNDYLPLKWDIPGGYVESGETMEQALLREICEEVSITVEIMKPLMIYTNLSQLPEKQTFQAIYLCQYQSGSVKTTPEEHDAFLWVPLNALESLDSVPFLRAFAENMSTW
jgi:8-oxo-dGTP diphosphatase